MQVSRDDHDAVLLDASALAARRRPTLLYGTDDLRPDRATPSPCPNDGLPSTSGGSNRDHEITPKRSVTDG